MERGWRENDPSVKKKRGLAGEVVRDALEADNGKKYSWVRGERLKFREV